VEVLAAGKSLALDEARHLVRLAAQSDDQYGGKVGVSRIASKRALKQGHRFSVRPRVAADFVGECYHPIDVRKIEKTFSAEELFAYDSRDCRRAVDCSQDPNEIAGSHSAIGSHNALECGGLILSEHLDGPAIGPNRMPGSALAEREIVGVNMFAGRNRYCRNPDDVSEFPHRTAFGNVDDGDFMSAGNSVAGCHALERWFAGPKAAHRHCKIVLGVKLEDRRLVRKDVHRSVSPLDRETVPRDRTCPLVSLTIRLLTRKSAAKRLTSAE
jgi:hypothetical protein